VPTSNIPPQPPVKDLLEFSPEALLGGPRALAVIPEKKGGSSKLKVKSITTST